MTTHDTSGSDTDPQDEPSRWRQADKFSLDSIAVTAATGDDRPFSDVLDNLVIL